MSVSTFESEDETIQGLAPTDLAPDVAQNLANEYRVTMFVTDPDDETTVIDPE